MCFIVPINISPPISVPTYFHGKLWSLKFRKCVKPYKFFVFWSSCKYLSKLCPFVSLHCSNVSANVYLFVLELTQPYSFPANVMTGIIQSYFILRVSSSHCRPIMMMVVGVSHPVRHFLYWWNSQVWVKVMGGMWWWFQQGQQIGLQAKLQRQYSFSSGSALQSFNSRMAKQCPKYHRGSEYANNQPG